MYDLVKVNDNDYYIDYPSKIGIVRINDNDVVLIDSGNDAYSAKKTLKILNENGWNLKAVFNTHCHADHIGGNKYLQEHTGCKCFAFKTEEHFANATYFGPIALFGAKPIKKLNGKFFKAEQSVVSPLTESDLPDGISIILLPGHTESMIGFLTKDKTAFIADVVSSEKTIEKYGVCYLWDYKTALNTLDYVKEIDAEIFVPSHAEASKDISALIEVNKEQILKTESLLLEICKKPTAFDEILKQVFDYFSLSMTEGQFALVGSTIRSYLSKMQEEKLLDIEFKDNYMLWVKKND